MNTDNNTHESYVSLETANMLKEAGFDWKEYLKPLSIYDGGGSVWKIPLHIAQKWLREVKNREVFVECISGEKKYKCYYTHGLVNMATSNFYSTYEEALEAGIQKCLTILLEEKK